MGGRDDLDWLGRYGGWVLLVLGIALVAVSVFFANGQTLAATLAFLGVAAAVFGVLLSRLEGDFEFSPTKFVGTLRAVRRIGIRDDLTLEEKADVILGLVGVGDRAQESPAAEAMEASESDDTRPGQPAGDTRRSLPRPIPFTVTGDTNQVHAVGMAFERHVAEVFTRAGWEVENAVDHPDLGFDLLAKKQGTALYIEVKLRRRLSTADARRFVDVALSRKEIQEARYVLAVNTGALSPAARVALAAAPSMEVWEVPVEGW
jgi:Holliday junction resolvase-like predicted endonuclease